MYSECGMQMSGQYDILYSVFIVLFRYRFFTFLFNAITFLNESKNYL